MQEKHNVQCPNCNQNSYHETLSREWCTKCGIECDYHGGGLNKAMQNYMEERAFAAHLQEQKEWSDWISDESNWKY